MDCKNIPYKYDSFYLYFLIKQHLNINNDELHIDTPENPLMFSEYSIGCEITLPFLIRTTSFTFTT